MRPLGKNTFLRVPEKKAMETDNARKLINIYKVDQT